MNIKLPARQNRHVFVLALVACFAPALPGIAAAADPVNLEGTWKIVAPQSFFKPEGGAIPFTKAGTERYRRNQGLRAKGNYEDFDYASARCSTPGTPRLMLTPERFRIWQRTGMVLMQFEWNRQLRQIDMGTLIRQVRLAPGPLSANEDLTGRSTPVALGSWDGKTLVVTSRGFNDSTLVDALVPHGWDMKVTERLRLTDANTLEDRITIEDPEYFEKPWQTVVTYKRQPDGPFREDVCLERHANGPAPL
jgi:hypothetical protein